MLRHQRWLLILAVVWTTDQTTLLVHSMGTLLHAGPSCIIKPNSHLHRHHHHHHYLHQSSPVKHRGICYSTLLCKQKGGVAIGKCGLGNSCCVFPQTCNSISVRNSTYFTSPDYPLNARPHQDQHRRQQHGETNEVNVDDDNGGGGGVSKGHHHDEVVDPDQPPNNQPCSLTIHRMPGIHPICRIRLDFIEYDVEGQSATHSTTITSAIDDGDHQPSSSSSSPVNNHTESNINGGGGCPSNHGQQQQQISPTWDRITVEARQRHQRQNEPITEPICPGSKIGQHVIIDVRKHLGPFVLTVHPGQWPAGRRRWNILINQIECPRQTLGSLILPKR